MAILATKFIFVASKWLFIGILLEMKQYLYLVTQVVVKQTLFYSHKSVEIIKLDSFK